jgi:hypothetical protein
MRKENCFESGSSGGTQCIEVPGAKRKKQAPQRSITVDEISVVDPSKLTSRKEENFLRSSAKEDKLVRSHGKGDHKEQLASRRETQSIFDCVYDPVEDFEVPSVVESNDSSPLGGKSDIPDSMF